MRDPHQSMTKVWQALEWLPKADRLKEWKALRSRFGYYIPNGEPRAVPPGAFFHESIVSRMEAAQHYRPINVPPSYRVVPMPTSS
jgi:hypothetical protein